MRKLILVRHSESKLDPDIPPQQWTLTQEGKRRCSPLASNLTVHHPEIIVTSKEIKACETGKNLAEILGIQCKKAPGLEEHWRERGLDLSRDAWLEKMANFFKTPDQLVFGLETANQTRKRFSVAVHAVMEQFPKENLVLVTHGTVMSLFYQDRTSMDPFHFWSQLGLPAFYTVSWPDCEVLSVVMNIVDG